MKQGLSLSRTAIECFWRTVLFDLCDVTANGSTTLDLSLIVDRAIRIMTLGTEFCLFEPIRRKFARAVGHVSPAENAEREHLFWCEFGVKVAMKIAPDRFDKQICVILLHLIVDLDPAFLDDLRSRSVCG